MGARRMTSGYGYTHERVQTQAQAQARDRLRAGLCHLHRLQQPLSPHDSEPYDFDTPSPATTLNPTTLTPPPLRATCIACSSTPQPSTAGRSGRTARAPAAPAPCPGGGAAAASGPRSSESPRRWSKQRTNRARSEGEARLSERAA